MWNYQEIIFEHDIHWVLETGTRHGGSALFFADLLAAAKREGCIVTIDVTHEALDPVAAAHRGIRFLLGDSTAESIKRQVEALIPDQRRGGLLQILDSDHAESHVLRELETWVPLLRKGDYLVVEDTIVNGHPVRPEFGPGPMEAVDAFIARHPGRLRPDGARGAKFGCSFAEKGYFVAL
jgi:cephalosporin hydroxylase